MQREAREGELPRLTSRGLQPAAPEGGLARLPSPQDATSPGLPRLVLHPMTPTGEVQPPMSPLRLETPRFVARGARDSPESRLRSRDQRRSSPVRAPGAKSTHAAVNSGGGLLAASGLRPRGCGA